MSGFDSTLRSEAAAHNDSSAFAGHRARALFVASAPTNDQPLARDFISFASRSISSAFRTMANDSIVTESVFSTSFFNSVAS